MKFIQRYNQHNPKLYHHQLPLALDNPKLVHLNTKLLSQLGLDTSVIDWQAVIGGQLDDLMAAASKQGDGLDPLAMVYAGHQFGQWAGQLGDGRGLLIAEVLDKAGDIHELHLKGSGKTPYSRHGDGRAMIASTVREYLCSHALSHLGIATSTAIGFVVSDTLIHRGQLERAAALLRVSDCHVRLGHIEWVACYAPEIFPAFIDKLIADYYPQLHRSQTNKATDIVAFVRQIALRTARLIASWQLVGFSHGVMNTDNLNITGSTLDFGPFGFMERFDPTWVNNASDHTARYCYQNQPTIGHYNLATSLRHLYQLGLTDAHLRQILLDYENEFIKQYHQGLFAKFGFEVFDSSQQDNLEQLCYDFLYLLQNHALDYTNSFRALIAVVDERQHLSQYAHEYALLDILYQELSHQGKKDWENWLKRYKSAIALSSSPTTTLINKLSTTNPVYVLRNHLAQSAIDGVLNDDFSALNRIFTLLSNPYQYQDISSPNDVHSSPKSQVATVSCLS